ncbi:uncharacterized protein LOC129892959 [Solanum dulcamara]|uniref:uncharacterized protein LOC129892959 n=1 Tax=Solanum dulcamara TaxID=45834 RepID=UPI002485C335|nr:uncharacterized protein LOC129892959 [Solanum dulcamara]
MDELTTGRGLNQQLGLSRACDTRWVSHYKSFNNFIIMFGSILDVLESLSLDARNLDERAKAMGHLEACRTYEVGFILHLMRDVLGITNELNKCLQKKEQDIANVMLLIEVAKRRLQVLRDDEWDSLIAKVSTFCIQHDVLIPNFEEPYISSLRSRRKLVNYTISHHYRVEVFCNIIDWQIQELNNRFDEVTIDLLHGIACLNPINSFLSFDIKKVMRMAKLYLDDFDESNMSALKNQLASYIVDVRDVDERFSNTNRLCDLSKRLVQTKKHFTYPLVFRLVKLALLLPVVTASVERAFLTMKFIKNDLRSQMSDDFFSGCLELKRIQKKLKKMEKDPASCKTEFIELYSVVGLLFLGSKKITAELKKLMAKNIRRICVIAFMVILTLCLLVLPLVLPPLPPPPLLLLFVPAILFVFLIFLAFSPSLPPADGSR